MANNNTTHELHKVDIYYGDINDKYCGEHYTHVTDIIISIFRRKIVIKNLDHRTTEPQSFKYNIDDVIAIVVDDELYEMENIDITEWRTEE